MSQHLTVGQVIKVPCTLAGGSPFSDEPLVTVDTTQGPISGFVESDEIEYDESHNTFVKGVVRAIHNDTIDLWIRGSFFTTSGFAAVHRARVAAA
jgi:hypothetical protein